MGARLVLIGGREYPGRTYEEFEAGQRFDSFSPVPVSAIKVKAFGVLTGDENSLHGNSWFCGLTKFKEPIGQGMLTLSLVMGMCHKAGLWEGTCRGFASIGEAWFSNPVKIGDSISLTLAVEKKSEGTSNGKVTFIATVFRESDKASVARMIFTLLIAKRSFLERA